MHAPVAGCITELAAGRVALVRATVPPSVGKIDTAVHALILNVAEIVRSLSMTTWAIASESGVTPVTASSSTAGSP